MPLSSPPTSDFKPAPSCEPRFRERTGQPEDLAEDLFDHVPRQVVHRRDQHADKLPPGPSAADRPGLDRHHAVRAAISTPKPTSAAPPTRSPARTAPGRRRTLRAPVSARAQTLSQSQREQRVGRHQACLRGRRRSAPPWHQRRQHARVEDADLRVDEVRCEPGAPRRPPRAAGATGRSVGSTRRGPRRGLPASGCATSSWRPARPGRRAPASRRPAYASADAASTAASPPTASTPQTQQPRDDPRRRLPGRPAAARERGPRVRPPCQGRERPSAARACRARPADRRSSFPAAPCRRRAPDPLRLSRAAPRAP